MQKDEKIIQKIDKIYQKSGKMAKNNQKFGRGRSKKGQQKSQFFGARETPKFGGVGKSRKFPDFQNPRKIYIIPGYGCFYRFSYFLERVSTTQNRGFLAFFWVLPKFPGFLSYFRGIFRGFISGF